MTSHFTVVELCAPVARAVLRSCCCADCVVRGARARSESANANCATADGEGEKKRPRLVDRERLLRFI